MNLVHDAFAALGLEESNFSAQVGNPAGQIDLASWWIDNRELTPQQLPHALAAVLGTNTTGSENPF